MCAQDVVLRIIVATPIMLGASRATLGNAGGGGTCGAEDKTGVKHIQGT